VQKTNKKETPNIKTQCIKWCEKFKSPYSLLVNKKLCSCVLGVWVVAHSFHFTQKVIEEEI